MTVLEPSRWPSGITAVDQGWAYRVFRNRLTGLRPLDPRLLRYSAAARGYWQASLGEDS